MIFIRYESFQAYLKLYPITSAILGLNLLLFILSQIVGLPLLEFGAFIQMPADPYGLIEPWRYVTSQFLHLSWQHILFNCFSILVFAPPLERLLGSLRYLVFYLLCGIVGNLFSALWGPAWLVSAGASGAIYGVFGAYLNLALIRKDMLDAASRKTVYTILILGIVFSFMTVTRVNILAHVGGLAAGFALYAPFAARVRR
ncbi:rhomboid family intramembrane serine protease [Paenibacillus sp. IB182496]|uniref:Rhomboid family intramembrane serine protease n=1 Tax=Paenibacillus sabuli TaxID=2772509 RepID=A0A927GSU9_9BACL|nr:rhomboid family intramembrane serine protease [Paenibacillus sabuli]MBD2846047.1 rhomboid family intramembrane serine protease [Paenibacillus sabuli]